MRTKKKFKPVITRVKLNPEQAVLTCDCYDSGHSSGFFATSFTRVCDSFGKGTFFTNEIGDFSSRS